MGEPPNSTHRRVPSRALREIQPPTEIRGATLIDRKRSELWKEELNEELENYRRILGKSKSTVPNGIKIRKDVAANQSSVKGKSSSSEKDSSISDRERRWKEELDQELEMLRSCRRNRRQPSVVCKPPPPMAAESSSEEQQ